MYKEPDQVVNWFYSNDEQLKNIESISLININNYDEWFKSMNKYYSLDKFFEV